MFSFCRHFLIFVCLLLLGSCVAAAQEKKMDLPELLSRHRDAVGSAAARGKIKSRFAAGTVRYVSRVGSSGNLDGTIGLVSLAPKLRYSIKFPSQQYPGEQLAFDGKNLDVGVLQGGRRSDLSLFMQQQDLPLKEGLFGGVLSTGWPLLKDPLAARLEYKGTRKIDGRPLHVVGYRPQKGSPDLKVTLYFDPETFRHVRSEYEFEIGARIGIGPNQSTKIPESHYLLSEDFDDFRAVDGMMLPHRCKIQLSEQTSMRNILVDWTLSFTQMTHNQPVDDNVFTLK
ncbi:MAG: hypothetical protein DMF60_21430 [Acidobacteria bacterium]|nr:MAG: hypothetical protein DMF60_21430 [Acidobacteriota bacterium]